MKRILIVMALFISLVFGAVDLNTASKQELMNVKGIGAKRADAIIEYRSKTPFKSVDDLKNVKGFGGKLFQKVKNEVSVSGEKATTTKDTKTTSKESNKKSSKTKNGKSNKNSKTSQDNKADSQPQE